MYCTNNREVASRNTSSHTHQLESPILFPAFVVIKFSQLQNSCWPDWNVCKWHVEEIFTIFFVADIFKEYYILRISPLYIEQQLGK